MFDRPFFGFVLIWQDPLESFVEHLVFDRPIPSFPIQSTMAMGHGIGTPPADVSCASGLYKEEDEEAEAVVAVLSLLELHDMMQDQLLKLVRKLPWDGRADSVCMPSASACVKVC